MPASRLRPTQLPAEPSEKGAQSTILRELRIRQVRFACKVLRASAWFRLGRSFIRGYRRTEIGRAVLNVALGYARPFRTLPEAEAAVLPYAGGGHRNEANVDLHLKLNRKPRPSDYAAMFHLAENCSTARSIFDFGGNVGNLYYCYAKYIRFRNDLIWSVYDLPDNIKRGEQLAEDRKAQRLRFTERLDDASGADVLIASGSLHYFDKPLPQIVEELPRKPHFVLVNRTPLTDAGNIAIVQDAGAFRVACMLYNRDELIRDFVRLGYRVVSTWEAPELKLDVPASPEHSVSAYSGFWLELPA